MSYINTSTLEYPLTAVQIIVANPHISFPNPFELPPGYAAVQETQQPAFDPATQKCVEITPINVGNIWSQAWEVIELTPEEIAERAAAEAEKLAAAKVAKITELNAAHLAANRTTFPYNGQEISCDELNRGDIDCTNSEILNQSALPASWTGSWPAKNGTPVPITTVAEWNSFYSSMFDTMSANRAHGQQLTAEVEAATSIAQVNSITW